MEEDWEMEEWEEQEKEIDLEIDEKATSPPSPSWGITITDPATGKKLLPEHPFLETALKSDPLLRRLIVGPVARGERGLTVAGAEALSMLRRIEALKEQEKSHLPPGTQTITLLTKAGTRIHMITAGDTQTQAAAQTRAAAIAATRDQAENKRETALLTKERLQFGLVDPLLDNATKALIKTVWEYIAEKDSRALAVIGDIVERDPPRATEYLMLLSDTNITGSRILCGLHYCHHNLNKFMKRLILKDPGMARYINDYIPDFGNISRVDMHSPREY
jgi:hypothetical protein